MANEITVLIDASLANNKVTNTFSPGVVQITQTSAKVLDVILTIGTTEEAITFTDFAGSPLVFLYNLSASNYVEWGLTASYPGRLIVGDPPTSFRVNASSTIYLKANTAACEVRVVAYDA